MESSIGTVATCIGPNDARLLLEFSNWLVLWTDESLRLIVAMTNRSCPLMQRTRKRLGRSMIRSYPNDVASRERGSCAKR